MRTNARFALILALMTLLVPLPAAAQAASDTDGLRGELLGDLAVLEQKYVGLAEAVPAEQYDWRPTEVVRSFNQVFGHVVASNYYYSGLFAEGRPADVGIENAPEDLEEVTEKTRVVALLRTGFANLREAIESTPAGELDREVTLYGSPSTVRAVMLQTVTHMHEHLGQMIAYARSIGVAPPWSG